jgi:hypothetical protein
MKKNNEVGVALKESEVKDYPNICVVRSFSYVFHVL